MATKIKGTHIARSEKLSSTAPQLPDSLLTVVKSEKEKEKKWNAQGEEQADERRNEGRGSMNGFKIDESTYPLRSKYIA